MILVIDNYDSFTYNLVQHLGEMHQMIQVYRNDKISLCDIKKIKPDYIVISPGPGRPKEAGISKAVIKEFSGKVPILGVCLGHQCIGEACGAKIVRAKRIMHGKISKIYHNGRGIFKNIRNPFEATRYHSLIIQTQSLPREVSIVAETAQKEIMAVKHKRHNLWGVQFHPESILTPDGKQILKNFLSLK